MKQAAAGFLVALVALSPVPAVALSCSEYSIRAAYWSYEWRDEPYLLAYGSFSEIRRAFPGDRKRAHIFQARFSGHTASRRAFDQEFKAQVLLDFREAAMITGDPGLPEGLSKHFSGETGLIWLEKTLEGYSARHNLCWPLVDTDPASVKPALQCLRGGHCPKPKNE
jgi:hypothetical protein